MQPNVPLHKPYAGRNGRVLVPYIRVPIAVSYFQH